jgi:glyoxylase-like metal-dependent hydrolase (beta-lactamase superfamily II)
MVTAATATAQQDFDSVEIHALHVRGNVYMLVGAGGNITLQAGEQGVLVVDTMYAPLSDKVLAAIRAISDRPITWIINTHGHPDHVGGNAPISIAGSNIGGGNVQRAIQDSGANARIIAHENVLLDIAGQDPAIPFEGWPTDTFFTPTKEIFFNGEAIQVIHQPNAHTDGDSLVFFRRTDVLSTGDLYLTTSYPFIDVENGGTYQGIIDALNNILDIAIPADRQEGGTMIIPGHGRLSDEAEVLDYRDMLTIIRDRIQHMVDDGFSLRQVRAAEPTSDYDVRWGIDADFWSTDRFIETVYNELRANQ